jgi:hypothetical protein
MPHSSRDRRLLQDNQPPLTINGYLLNDTFTTDRTAGAVNGTAAEPGPGVREATDTNSKLSLASGSVSFATGGGAASDPRLSYQPVARATGLLIKGTILHTSQGANWGLTQTLATPPSEAIRINGTSLSLRVNAVGLVVGTAATTTRYELAIVLRSSGAHYFIKGGAFSNWTLLWVSALVAVTPLIPVVEAIASNSVFTNEYIYIPPDRWLPVPLASDGFGLAAFGPTDGAGHAEGIAGGLGTGGAGLTYTTVGTWGVASGVANASALSSGSAIAYINAGKADVLATVALTRASGEGGLLLRYADGNNFVTCRHDGTNVVLVKKVAGVNTTVQTTATTYVAGAELRVSCVGSAFRVYYNDLLVGSEQTISDAALQSPTNYGLYTTATTNTFDNLVIWVRGAGGEYSALGGF